MVGETEGMKENSGHVVCVYVSNQGGSSPSRLAADRVPGSAVLKW